MENEFEAIIYACQEDFVDGHNSGAGYKAETASLPLGPVFDSTRTAAVPLFHTICDEVFAPATRDNRLEPVVSDPPVLLMNGERTCRPLMPGAPSPQ